ncbi:MAG: aminopeptidase P family protein [Rhodospirillales bacterium]|nr:aminopeptidase P family protein [Rhodospirillales bacterium]
MKIGTPLSAGEASKIRPALAFSVEEYKGRLARVRKAMAEKGLTGLFLHGPENICYLSGFHTPGYYFIQALLVPMAGEPVLVTRYIEQTGAHAYAWMDRDRLIGYRDTDDPLAILVGALGDLGLTKGRLGIEMSGYSFLPLDRFRDLEKRLPGVELVNASGIVEQERAVKSPAEAAYIRRSCRISDLAMEAARRNCRAGITEHELAGHINKALAENGGEYAGLPLFLSSGHRTYVRHAVPDDKVIEKGDCVLVELTGVVRRYAGPLFRTFSVGKPSKEFAHHSAIARDMLEAAMAAIRPGVTSGDVDRATVDVARKAGLAVGVTKRTGYSVGLNFPPDWGEGVFLDLRTDDPTVLKAGMAFHLPQAVRVGGGTPTTISETVLVTETGVDILTQFKPRELVEV